MLRKAQLAPLEANWAIPVFKDVARGFHGFDRPERENKVIDITILMI